MNKLNNTFISDYPVGKQLLLLVVILLLMFGSYLGPEISKRLFTSDKTPENIPYRELGTTPSDTTFADEGLDITIEGRSAFVWDVSAQRVLYQKNPDDTLPLASITKLMTALLAHELVDEQEKVPISLSAIEQEGSSGFYDGEAFSLQSLSDLILLSSSNDGAYAIATAVGSRLQPERGASAFIDGMNIRAEELGLTQTRFYNPTGLDVSKTQAGAYGSARDVSFLMEHILLEYPELLEATTEVSDTFYNTAGAYHNADNTNPLVDEIPGLIGSKTGYTDLAGGNLTIAYNDGLNRPIIVTVLGSSWRGRFNDVAAIVAAIAEQ